MDRVLSNPRQTKDSNERSACGVFGPAGGVGGWRCAAMDPSGAGHRCASRHAVMPPFKTKTRSNPESRRIRAAASESAGSVVARKRSNGRIYRIGVRHDNRNYYSRVQPRSKWHLVATIENTTCASPHSALTSRFQERSPIDRSRRRRQNARERLRTPRKPEKRHLQYPIQALASLFGCVGAPVAMVQASPVKSPA